MTPIFNALAQGYTSSQLMQYLMRAFPNLSPKISQAAANGYSINEIISYLNNSLSTDKKQKNLSPHEIEALNQQKTNRTGKQVLGTAATALGASRIAPAIAQAAKGLFGGQKGPQIGPQPMGGAPVQPTSPNDLQQIDETQANIPPSSQPQAQPAPINAGNIIDQMGLGDQIKNLANAGNNPEQISAAVGVSLKPNQRKWLDQQIKEGTAKSLPDLIADYLSGGKKNSTTATQSPTESIQPQNTQTEHEPSIGKGSIVGTSSGQSGILKDIRNKEGLIDEDGKLHKVKIEDLEPIPESIQKKDYQSIAQEYISTFPEKGEGSLSDALSILSYNPKTKQMFVVFPDSPTNMGQYENIEPEIYEKIISASTRPKTSGGTGIPGTWDVNTADSRGSPFREVSTNPEKYPYSKFSIGYNMMEKLSLAIKELRKQKRRGKK